MWVRLDNLYIAGSITMILTKSHRMILKCPMEEHFTRNGHTLVDVVVTVTHQMYCRDTCPQNMGEQVDKDSGDLTSFGNEPQS